MSIPDNLFVTWLNRPYLDLEFCQSGPLHLRGIEYSYRNLVENISTPNPVTIIHPLSFRESLIRESGLFQYQINNPLELAHELRTERWNKLCDYLTHYQELKPTTQLRTIYLLSSLCLHKAVLEYMPEISKSEIASNSTVALLALCRAISNLMLQSNAGILNNLKEFENIANQAVESQVRFNAAIQLIILYAKTFRNLESAKFWRSVAIQELDNFKTRHDGFSYKHMTSICYRAVVFVPLLQEDKETVVQEMNLCQYLAESMICECKNEVEQKYKWMNSLFRL